MGKSLADAMNAQPGPDSLAYWLAPLKGYWDRQGRMAQQGLQMADEGARAVRGGDFSGLGGALLGPVAYLASPINALFPERAEVDAATDVPSWSKPLIAGGLETMAIMAPGPKGKGLGRGLNELTDAATDAERAALAARLGTEATQTLPPFTAYHGSPVEGLSALKPGERGPFGPATYLSPVKDVAGRYGSNVYEARLNPNEIFNGLGSRYFDGDVNGYEMWRNQVSRVAKASGEKAGEVAAVLGKLDPQDGYRAYHDLRRIMGSDAEAQAVLQRAGFKGMSGHVDGPEIAMFGDVDLGSAPVTRDQALRNLTEAPQAAPEYPWLKPSPQANYREAAALRMQIEPLETQLKAALQSKNATKAATLREKLKAIRDRVAQLSPGGPLLSADRVDEILKAHPNADLSAEDIAKMFPEE